MSPREEQVERFQTDLAPGGVEYEVVAPEDRSAEPLPLLLALHGGNGHAGFAALVRWRLAPLWKSGEVPPFVAIVPRSGRSFWLDRADGAVRWESVLQGPLLDHCATAHDADASPAKTLLFGISMGGMGVLRLAFRHPERFAGVTALEPGIEPALRYEDVRPEHTFFRPQELIEKLHGNPVDPEHWAASHPPAILDANPDPIRQSDLKIYLEVGNQDMLNLHHGAEFLHRQLWDLGVEHEYRLIDGADHIGRTLAGRVDDAFRFLARVLNPPGPDPEVEAVKKALTGKGGFLLNE
ncbi:MAG: alpha/beta hydrolase-fold protein [Candidatus Binatia bacterium]|nr:alpha/beta hydrolase-fold protein [Candidatus Binatia bacterium]